MFINRAGTNGRIAILHDGVAPSHPGFVQTSALASPLLPRIDATDIVLAGPLTSTGRADLVTIEP